SRQYAASGLNVGYLTSDIRSEINLPASPGYARHASLVRGADRQLRRGETMPRKVNAIRLGTAGFLVAVAVTLLLVFTGGARPDRESTAKLSGEPDAAATSGSDSPGEAPIGGYEAYISAARTYPANAIP